MHSIDLLTNLVSIPSVFPHEYDIAIFIERYLKGFGFSVERVFSGHKRFNVIATHGISKKYLAFYGHLDTVSPDGRKDPYSVRVAKNIAFGLGVADMKGGITAILQLGEYASMNNLPVKLIFGVDEENISKGAHDLVDSGRLSGISFLISAESGQAADLKQPFGLCFGRKGRILFEAIIQGKKAHAAESEKGINAIEKGAEFVSLLKKMRFREHSKLGESKIIIHSIESHANAFSLPGSCYIQFSLLSSPLTKSSEFLKEIKNLCQKSDINLTVRPVKRPTPYAESYEVIESPFLQMLEKRVFKPNHVKPLYATSVADENVFANRLKIPVITLGPVGGGDHTEQEWLNMKSLSETENVYRQILDLFFSTSRL